jgi:hypothetical protein
MGTLLYSQNASNQLYSVSIKNQYVKDALVNLATLLPITFSYNPEIIPEIRVSVSAEKKTLEYILNDLLENTKLEYRRAGDYMIIFENPEKKLVKDELDNEAISKNVYSSGTNGKANEKSVKFDSLSLVLYYSDTIKERVIIYDTIRTIETKYVVDTIFVTKYYETKYRSRIWAIGILSSMYSERLGILPLKVNSLQLLDSAKRIFTQSFGYSTGIGAYVKSGNLYVGLEVSLFQFYQGFKDIGPNEEPNQNLFYKKSRLNTSCNAGYIIPSNFVDFFVEGCITADISISKQDKFLLFENLGYGNDIKIVDPLFWYQVSGGVSFNISESLRFLLKVSYRETLQSVYQSSDFDFQYSGLGLTTGVKLWF